MQVHLHNNTGEGQQEPTDRVSSLGSTEEKETRSLIEDTSDVSGEHHETLKISIDMVLWLLIGR